MEYQLFENLFPGRDPSSGALSPLIDTLADMLYETLRPAYIHLQDLAALCQLVDILQREVPPTPAPPAHPYVAGSGRPLSAVEHRI